jgi:hypothetical protein
MGVEVVLRALGSDAAEAREAAGRSGCIRWASEAFGISDISLRRLLGRARGAYLRIRGGGSGESAGGRPLRAL